MAKQISFFLSGAQNFELSQLDFNSSLGGYPSNTPIPKDLINSVFSEISTYDLKNKGTDTIAIFIKNTGNETLTSLVIKAIYDEVLGSPDSYCKFEFATSELNENNYIELIGSRKETPYYSEFFEPIFRREDANLIITNPGENGDALEILGQTFDLTGDTIESAVDDIVANFKNSTTYSVKKKNASTVYIKKLALTITNSEIDIVTTGNLQIQQTFFGDGLDESFDLLNEDLLPGKYLGLWIRRIFRDDVDTCDISKDKYKKENLEINFSF